jgi:hypothetical protein
MLRPTMKKFFLNKNISMGKIRYDKVGRKIVVYTLLFTADYAFITHSFRVWPEHQISE